jgi:hypothetical protein
MMSELMSDTAKNAGPDVYNAWKDADNFTNVGRKIFSDDVTKKMFVLEDSLPEKIGSNLFDSPDASRIDQLKDVFHRVEDLAYNPKNNIELQKVIAQAGDQAPVILKRIESGDLTYESQMRDLKQGIVNKFLRKFSSDEPNSLNKTKINYAAAVSQLNPETDAGSEFENMLKKVMTPQQIGELRNNLNAGKLAVQKNPEAVDRAMMWGMRILAGAIGGPVLGFIGGEGTFLMSESTMASKLLTDPVVAPMFQNALKAFSQPTPAGVKLGTDLVVRAAKTYADNYIKTRLIEPEENQ